VTYDLNFKRYFLMEKDDVTYLHVEIIKINDL
jgi:hypothetical protein